MALVDDVHYYLNQQDRVSGRAFFDTFTPPDIHPESKDMMMALNGFFTRTLFNPKVKGYEKIQAGLRDDLTIEQWKLYFVTHVVPFVVKHKLLHAQAQDEMPPWETAP